MRFITAVLALLLCASAAQADPVTTAFALIQNGVAVGAAITASFGTFGAFLIKSVASAALSLLGQALQKKPKKPGLQTEFTTTGGTEPQSFILGRYATAGHQVYMNSHGTAGGTPNAYLNYVIELSDIPGVTLSRVIVDGEYCTLGETDHADYGTPLTNLQGKNGGDRAWIKFYDGTQTTVDPMLATQYWSGGDDAGPRPWGSTFIGTGIAYAVLTFRLDRKVFSGFPKVRFELDGIPLYDIRKDSTAGGSGTHRWDDQSTWTPTDNPIVMVYNIARGITMPCGALFGGDVAAGNLPTANWVAAMNACDVSVGSTVRPAYRAGFEVRVGPRDLGGDEPAEVIEELLKASGGQITETGGVFRVRVGGPGAPVLHITDDDIVTTDPQQFKPFPGLESTYNGISYTHPDPGSVWEGREGEPIYNNTYETEDGGRRLIASLQLPACPYPEQASQLAHAYIEDERRFRQHRIYLPPEYAALEGLDAITWTSPWNGYTSKVFEVTGGEYLPKSQVVAVDLRERDPNDFDYDGDYDIPSTDISTDIERQSVQAVPGFAVRAVAILDDSGVQRRPAIEISWDATDLDEEHGLMWELRRSGQSDAEAYGSTQNLEAEALLLTDILPDVTYEVRAQLIADRDTEWTAWTAVTTDDVRLSAADIVDSLNDKINTAFDRHDETLTTLTPGGAVFNLLSEVRIEDAILAAQDVSNTAQDVVAFEETGDNKAAIVTEQIARADADSALASDVTALTSRVGDNESNISNIQTTKVDASGAIAAVEAEISAEYNGLSAQASATAFAKATADKIEAGYVWRLNNENLIELVSVQDGVDTGPTSTFKIDADYVQITGLTQIDQAVINTLAADNGFISNLTVDTLNIAGNAVTVPASASGAQKTGNGSMQELCSVTLDVPVGSDYLIVWTIEQGYADFASPPTWGYQIRRESPFSGNTIIDQRLNMAAANDFPTGQLLTTLVFGESVTFTLEWEGQDADITASGFMTAMAVMR